MSVFCTICHYGVIAILGIFEGPLFIHFFFFILEVFQPTEKLKSKMNDNPFISSLNLTRVVPAL